MAVSFLFVGLGNPGQLYRNNRHNAGFMAIDAIAESFDVNFSRKHDGEVAVHNSRDCKLILFKPHTFMNLSGIAVAKVLSYYKLDLSALTVFHDELDIETGRIKIKTGGGSGGHNGIKSIDAQCGNEYHRVRIGIGHPGDKNLVSSYVLSDFTTSESERISKTLGDIVNAAKFINTADIEGFKTGLLAAK